MAEKEKQSLKTDFNATEKVLKILTAFLPFNEPKGTLELARTLGIHRASVSRILGILKKYEELSVKSKGTSFESELNKTIDSLRRKAKSYSYLKGTWRNKNRQDNFFQFH